METTFYNVTITIEANSPEDAYKLLCNSLGSLECEWETDTYSIDTLGEKTNDCAELYPADRGI